MKITKAPSLIVILFSLLAAGNVPAQPGFGGSLLTVDHNSDTHDANPGDGLCADPAGNCTLRAALDEANARPDSDVISFALPPGSVIDLTLGQLTITGSVSIVGPGARRLTIRRSQNPETPNFRIFLVQSNAGSGTRIRGLTIRNGNAGAGEKGGGIFIESGNTVNLTDLDISDNAAQDGGGIANAGTVNLSRSTISSNVAAAGQGGAFLNADGNSLARIINSTITANSASTGGGLQNNGSVLLVNDSISGNSATASGSSIVNAKGAQTHVLNTIIGQDNSTTATALSGAFSSLGNNIVTDARQSSGFTNGVNNDQVSDDNSINPLLGNLTDNGGQTDTLSLQTGSPAINAGNSCVFNPSCSLPLNTPSLFLLSDQRNVHSRLSGPAVDIGAFETGSGVLSSNGGFNFAIFGRTGFYAGSFAVLTDPVDNSKRYSFFNMTNHVSFRNLNGRGVYIMEIKSKRSSFPPFVFAFSDVFFGLTFENDGFSAVFTPLNKN
ncbi:MAG: choice-of-anchor Q domain-containing protein [Pyrinomonadaceae bacterium]